MPKKKELTKRPKVYYNGSIPIEHCGRVMAFRLDDKIYIPCKKCGKWVGINIENSVKA
jgi:hypothetical protein